MFNLQTRTKHDKDKTKIDEMNANRPLKWYTSDTQQNRTLEYGNFRDFKIENNLSRSKPTRLNEVNRPSGMLYGTAPLMSLNDGNKDIETGLFHGEIDGFTKCNMVDIHEYDTSKYYTKDNVPSLYAGLPLMIEPNRVGKSTRNEQIKYGN